MKKNELIGRYPYVCSDCPELQPFKSRVKYARHRAARHSVVIDIPGAETRGRPVLELYDLEPAPLRCSVLGATASEIQFGEPGHGTGALPSLDAYDEPGRW